MLKDYQLGTQPFINNIIFRELKTNYNREEALPRDCRYVLEYIQQLDRVLANVKRARATILEVKYYQSIDRLEIVGYKIAAEEQYSN